VGAPRSGGGNQIKSLCRQNARITGALSLPGIGLGESPLQMEFTVSLLIALLA
jgi:hypothetical protein